MINSCQEAQKKKLLEGLIFGVLQSYNFSSESSGVATCSTMFGPHLTVPSQQLLAKITQSKPSAPLVSSLGDELVAKKNKQQQELEGLSIEVQKGTLWG